MSTFYSKDLIDKIRQAVDLETLMREYVQDFKTSGSSIVGSCPNCNGNKFTYTGSKSLYKCFKGCQIGGNDPIHFLTKIVGLEFVEAMQRLSELTGIKPDEKKEADILLPALRRLDPNSPEAEALKKQLEAMDQDDPAADILRYQLSIPTRIGKSNKKTGKDAVGKQRRKEVMGNFRDAQLSASGIKKKDQEWTIKIGEGTEQVIDRYQSASVDKAFKVIPGNDMVLHYINLDGQLMQYIGDRKKSKVLTRVRWQLPGQHLDKDRNEMKYQSPRGSGSRFWIPSALISAYKQELGIDTLVITEGEKKADCLTARGVYTLGIMGIHNFTASNSMPNTLNRIIKQCKVKNVVFLLDADWQELGKLKDAKISVDNRPKTFFKAVWKFREYCYEYVKAGVNLRIYFGAGRDTEYKGIDDLIMGKFDGSVDEVKKAIEVAMSAHQVAATGQSEIQLFNITEEGAYNIKKHWHIHTNKAFFDHYGDQLKDKVEFRLGGSKWKWSSDNEDFELAQALLPHETFWSESSYENKQGKTVKQFKFIYRHIRNFLRNRGFGVNVPRPNEYRFLHVEDSIAQMVDYLYIRRFVLKFLEDINEPEVLEMVLAQPRYLGANNLSDMYQIGSDFNESDKNTMYLYFNNKYWCITKDSIEEKPIKQLPKPVWKEQIIDFDPQLISEPLIDLDFQDGKWVEKNRSELAKDCEMLRFLELTSNFHWRKEQKLVEEDGKSVWREEDGIKETVTEADIFMQRESLAVKMLATGYMAHDYIDYSNTKAVIAMDGVESKVGKSEGGTGKSIWCKMFKQIHPSFVIDGKEKKIEEDNHLFEGVDDRTRSIIFDDVRVNFNFEWTFSKITTGITVNPKGTSRFKLPPKKVAISTNHSLNGEGNSFDRRQYIITFSDYFNKYRTPNDEFGHQLFHDWDFEQKNLFLNFMAVCVQHFLRHGLIEGQNKEVIKKRKLRQRMGESFFTWCQEVFFPGNDETALDDRGIYLNKRVDRAYMLNQYKSINPRDSRFLNNSSFTDKIKCYCEYSGLKYNPTKDGGKIKSGANYFHCVADQDTFNTDFLSPPIKQDGDLEKWDSDHILSPF